ncbi:hypothetical protein HZC34_04810 [Candidatus Saganbacteria bacterium]|nr:hypothetical protein [Candidatus Saganbacteria bacterium]
MGKDDKGSFERKTNFSHTTGWVTEGRVKGGAIEADPSWKIRNLNPYDGVKELICTIRNDKISEFISKLEYKMDTTDDFHVYRIAAKGNDFKVYIDGTLRIDGTGVMPKIPSITENSFRWNDIAGTADSESSWDYVRYYEGGDKLPKKPKGGYISQMIDTTGSNNVGTGATISWNGIGVATDLYASASPIKPDVPCATGLANNAGVSIPNTCSGRYLWLGANLGNSDATLADITANYCSY